MTFDTGQVDGPRIHESRCVHTAPAMFPGRETTGAPPMIRSRRQMHIAAHPSPASFSSNAFYVSSCDLPLEIVIVDRRAVACI